LDAISANVFDILNRPHKNLDAEMMAEGIKSFKKQFSGEVWLEVMIVKGVNDSRSELERIEKKISEIGPDRIQINSVFRPPAEKGIAPVDKERLEFALQLFGDKAEIIGEFHKKAKISTQDNIHETILQLIKRRPCSIPQISKSLGTNEAVVKKQIRIMLNQRWIEAVMYEGQKFYKKRGKAL
jgi:wyosine [tRNA(Phe)-imidazoG37] synthetase (radical SAM superfamily)